MKRFPCTISAMVMAASASAAHADDWWLVSGAPGDNVAMFADVETLAPQDGGVRLRVLRIDRLGRSSDELQQVRCAGDPESGRGDALRRFACSSEGDRDRFGLLLVGMTPRQAAQMVFATGSPDTPPPGLDPKS